MKRATTWSIGHALRSAGFRSHNDENAGRYGLLCAPTGGYKVSERISWDGAPMGEFEVIYTGTDDAHAMVKAYAKALVAAGFDGEYVGIYTPAWEGITTHFVLVS